MDKTYDHLTLPQLKALEQKAKWWLLDTKWDQSTEGAYRFIEGTNRLIKIREQIKGQEGYEKRNTQSENTLST